MNLASVLSQEAVLPQLPAASKKQALKSLAEMAEKLTGLEADHIFSIVMEREHISGTGVGEGVAIPQGKFDALKRTCALFAVLKTPVEYGAPDGFPVDIIFLLLSPESANTEHLKVMAQATKLLRDRKLRKALREAISADEIHALLVKKA